MFRAYREFYLAAPQRTGRLFRVTVEPFSKDILDGLRKGRGGGVLEVAKLLEQRGDIRKAVGRWIECGFSIYAAEGDLYPGLAPSTITEFARYLPPDLEEYLRARMLNRLSKTPHSRSPGRSCAGRWRVGRQSPESTRSWKRHRWRWSRRFAVWPGCSSLALTTHRRTVSRTAGSSLNSSTPGVVLPRSTAAPAIENLPGSSSRECVPTADESKKQTAALFEHYGFENEFRDWWRGIASGWTTRRANPPSPFSWAARVEVHGWSSGCR